MGKCPMKINQSKKQKKKGMKNASRTSAFQIKFACNLRQRSAQWQKSVEDAESFAVTMRNKRRCLWEHNTEEVEKLCRGEDALAERGSVATVTLW